MDETTDGARLRTAMIAGLGVLAAATAGRELGVLPGDTALGSAAGAAAGIAVGYMVWAALRRRR